MVMCGVREMQDALRTVGAPQAHRAACPAEEALDAGELRVHLRPGPGGARGGDGELDVRPVAGVIAERVVTVAGVDRGGEVGVQPHVVVTGAGVDGRGRGQVAHGARDEERLVGVVAHEGRPAARRRPQAEAADGRPGQQRLGADRRPMGHVVDRELTCPRVAHPQPVRARAVVDGTTGQTGIGDLVQAGARGDDVVVGYARPPGADAVVAAAACRSDPPRRRCRRPPRRPRRRRTPPPRRSVPTNVSAPGPRLIGWPTGRVDSL